MNLLKSPLRRTTAVLAGAFIGMAGAVATALPASAHAPSVTGSTTCVQDGNWTIDWAFGNDHDLDAVVEDIKLDPAGAKLEGRITDAGAVIPAHSDGAADRQIHGTTKVSDAVGSVSVKVWLKWTDGYVTKPGQPATYTVQKPEACAPEKPETPASKPPASTPPTEDTPAEPKPILEAYCDALVIGLDNPADGEKITMLIETSKGEKRTLVVKPGEKKTTKFSASAGFTITVRATGLDTESQTIAWEKPEGCDSGSGGGDGELPVTGAAAGGIAGGAAGLLAIGGVLFYMARRRKVKFTA